MTVEPGLSIQNGHQNHDDHDNDENHDDDDHDENHDDDDDDWVTWVIVVKLVGNLTNASRLAQTPPTFCPCHHHRHHHNH